MPCTPFFYAVEPNTIVALVPDSEGVVLTANQQWRDNSWRRLCNVRFSWKEFTEFAQCAAQIAADPQAAMERITDPATGRPVIYGAKT